MRSRTVHLRRAPAAPAATAAAPPPPPATLAHWTSHLASSALSSPFICFSACAWILLLGVLAGTAGVRDGQACPAHVTPPTLPPVATDHDGLSQAADLLLSPGHFKQVWAGTPTYQAHRDQVLPVHCAPTFCQPLSLPAFL